LAASTYSPDPKPRLSAQTRTSQRTFCPSCGCYALFTYAGEQRVPPRVAAAAGLPRAFSLWHCSNCNTTLGELDLRF
jgi:hypothetical protein